MTWAFTQHVCRHCLGRIVHDGARFRCATCGAETGEAAPAAICGCGIRIAGMTGAKRLPTGFACGPNPNRGAKSPAEFVILFDGEPIEAPG